MKFTLTLTLSLYIMEETGEDYSMTFEWVEISDSVPRFCNISQYLPTCALGVFLGLICTFGHGLLDEHVHQPPLEF